MSLILDGSNGLSDVDGSAATPAIRGTDTNTGIFFPAADTIAFSEGGTEAMRINGSGDVGIGITSPTQKLDVIGVAQSYGFRVQGAASITGSGIWGLDTTLAFNCNSAERMRIVSGGGVVIAGTASIGSARFSTYGGGSAGDDCWSTRPITNITYNPAVFYNNAGSLIGFIQCSTSGTTFGTSSDYRLKENITPMTGALAKVALLKPCTYTWKSTGEESQGFIAHELAEVVPDSVVGEKDAVNEDGSIKPQGIDTSFLVATLTAAIQELKAELDTVKAELATLKA
jgi:hypothetical protein